MIFVSGQLLEELLRSLAAGDPGSLARMKSHLECLRGDGAGYALAAKREYERLVAERDALQARLDSIDNAALEARTRG